MRRSTALGSILALLLLAPASITAQTAQVVSIQGSGLGSLPFGGGLKTTDPGFGWEAQVRLTPRSVWSFGFGAEQTFHTTVNPDIDVTLFGGFFEPRLVFDVGSDALAPYLSARAAFSRSTRTQRVVGQPDVERTGTGYTLNGGGGVLIFLGGPVSLDVGVTIGYKDLGEIRQAGALIDLGSGINAIGRVGLAIGLFG